MDVLYELEEAAKIRRSLRVRRMKSELKEASLGVRPRRQRKVISGS